MTLPESTTPDRFHPDAHPDARTLTGDRQYGAWGQCTATAKSTGERCRGYAKGPHGKCRFHGGATPTADDDPTVGAPADNNHAVGNPGGGAPEHNTNALTHGVYAATATYYAQLDADDQAHVDRLFRSFVRDAPFGTDDYERCLELWDVAIALHKRRSVNEHLATEGLVHERVVASADVDAPITMATLHSVQRPSARLSRETTETLADFGVLTDASTDQPHASATLVEVVTELRAPTADGPDSSGEDRK